MNRPLILAYLVALHLGCGFLVTRTSTWHRLVGTASNEGDPTQGSFYRLMEHFHRCQDGNVEEGAILFFGDSQIQGLLCSRVDPSGVNFGIGTDTVSGLTQRIRGYESLSRASTVVLGVGINDLLVLEHEPAEVAVGIRELAAMVPDDCPVVISSIFFVDEGQYGKQINHGVSELNRLVRELCTENEKWWFCDAASETSDGDGNLDKSLHTGDGLHLNSAGNEIWISALRETLDALAASGTPIAPVKDPSGPQP